MKYSKMSAKKLNALLETANEDERVVIESELAAREAAKQAKTAKPAKVERTEDERAALIDELKANVIGHRCEVLPAGCPDWIGGVITSVSNDKRATNILLVIKTDDGRTVRKMHNAATLRVSEETVELVSIRRGRSAMPKDNTPWTTMDDEITEAAEHIGKMTVFNEFGQDGQETEGRIVSIVPDKRVKKLLYRIVTTDGKTVHKVTTAPLTFADELDETGAKIQAEYIARRETRANKTPKTLAEKIAQAEIDLQKLYERFVNLQAKIAGQEQALAELKAQAENNAEPEELI